MLTIGIVIGVFCYASIDYTDLNLMGTKQWLWVGGLSFLSALGMNALLKFKNTRVALSITTGYVFIQLAKIIYDNITMGSDSHNLAPLELIISCAQCFPFAWIGAWVANAIKK